jgi:hypothetical protein
MAWICPDRKVILRKRLPRIAAMTIKVIPAFRLRGSLKAVIPLDIASIPVKAAVPLEKACKIKKGPTRVTVCTDFER